MKKIINQVEDEGVTLNIKDEEEIQLEVRVGPVFVGNDKLKEKGIWLRMYQGECDHLMLINEESFNKMVEYVRSKL